MGEDPDQLKRDIEATRRELTKDVDALTEKVSPARVMERRVDRTKDAVSNLKERVMGSNTTTKTSSGISTVTSGAGSAADSVSDAASSAKSSVSDAASSAASSVSDAASTAKTAVADAPAIAKRKAEGNPMAAGLIAFGVGWLASALIPASSKEQQLAAKGMDAAKDAAGPVKEQLSQIAGEMKENLAEPAQQAVESIKSTATDAAAAVKDEAKSAGSDVAGQAKDAGQTVKQGASSGGSSSPSSDFDASRSSADPSYTTGSTYGSSYSETDAGGFADPSTRTDPYDLGQNPSSRDSNS